LKLRPYQNLAADFLYERDRAMILAPVGAGKTAITLTAMRDMLAAGEVQRFLVVAPKRVAVNVWPVEAKLWAPTLSLSVVIGTPTQRVKALQANVQVVVATYDNLQWLAEQPLRFDGVVFDELTRLKNPSGKRFKALLKVLGDMRIRWGLTGSFTSNGLEDVFGQCKVIDQSLLGRSKGAFLQQYFHCINRDFGEWTPAAGALAQVMERIKPATFVLDAGEYKDKLPPLHTVVMNCNMDMADYKDMKKNFMLLFPDTQAVAANAGVVTSKLQQMACLAKGTLVLTESGWLAIDEITTQRVWDGVEWVSHAGVMHKGQQSTTLCHGVSMTYNHLVLTVTGWLTAKEIIDGQSCGKFNRQEVWLPSGYEAGGKKCGGLRVMGLPLRLRQYCGAAKSIPTRRPTGASAQLRLLAREYTTWNEQQQTISYLVGYARSVLKQVKQRFCQLRWAGDYGLRDVVQIISNFLARHASHIPGLAFVGSRGQQWPVQQSKLPVGYASATAQQPARQRFYSNARGPGNAFASGQNAGHATADVLRPVESVRMDFGQSVINAGTEEVFDLAHCGPRNRFVVRGVDGRALIVHNCGFVYAEGKETKWMSDHKFEVLDDLLTENQHANTIIAYQYQAELAELQRRYPRAVTLDEPNAIDRWNAGKIAVLLAHPKSAGHGLNLQFGGCHMVFLSLPWSLELYEQTIGRLHRSGQTHDVWVYVLLTEGTVDKKIYDALHDKKSLSQLAMEALK
jgi:hypothetical protein